MLDYVVDARWQRPSWDEILNSTTRNGRRKVRMSQVDHAGEINSSWQRPQSGLQINSSENASNRRSCRICFRNLVTKGPSPDFGEMNLSTTRRANIEGLSKALSGAATSLTVQPRQNISTCTCPSLTFSTDYLERPSKTKTKTSLETFEKLCILNRAQGLFRNAIA